MANFLTAGLSIFIISIIIRQRLRNTGWVAWGMCFNILGTALTIVMIVLERYGIRNLMTLGYPLIFMRIGIMADMFFYQLALLEKWHYQEKQLAVEKLHSQLEVEKLRNKISAELHDDIGSTLSGISMYSHMADGLLQNHDYSKAKDAVSVIQKSANDIVHRLGDLVWAINPEKDSMAIMLERIEKYGNEICSAKNIGFYFFADVKVLVIEPGMDVRQHIFLLVKEAINNAVKYSQASLVKFEAFVEKDILRISVCDNGKGFDTILASNGNGLGNMKKRAESIEALLIMQSSIGAGTTVELRVKIT